MVTLAILMCFLSHHEAVCLFPSESFIHRRSLVNLTGRRVTYLPAYGFGYGPTIPLVPFKELNNYQARALVSTYLTGGAHEVIGIDYHYGWGIRVPYTPSFVRNGSDDDVATFCSGAERSFWEENVAHYFFSQETRFPTDRHTWNQPLWSRYAKALPPYSCGPMQKVAWQHDTFAFGFQRPPHRASTQTPWLHARDLPSDAAPSGGFYNFLKDVASLPECFTTDHVIGFQV
jgi:hypothetical protein